MKIGDKVRETATKKEGVIVGYQPMSKCFDGHEVFVRFYDDDEEHLIKERDLTVIQTTPIRP